MRTYCVLWMVLAVREQHPVYWRRQKSSVCPRVLGATKEGNRSGWPWHEGNLGKAPEVRHSGLNMKA